MSELIKNKKRAKRRALKVKYRSAPAKALEERQYRQRVLEHLIDDDEWKEDLREYYRGSRDVEERAATKEKQDSSTSLEQSVSIEDRSSDAELVDTRKKRR